MGFSDFFPKDNLNRFVNRVKSSPHLKGIGRDVSRAMADEIIFPAGDKFVDLTSFPYDNAFWNSTIKPFINSTIDTAFPPDKALPQGQ